MKPFVTLAWVAAGGAIGAVLRYVLSGLAYRVMGETFPWGTLFVNLLGSYVLGVVWTLGEEVALDPRVRPFLMIGVLGAFTTFSTFSLESLQLLRDGELGLALANAGGSVVLGLGAVLLGAWSARLLLGR